MRSKDFQVTVEGRGVFPIDMLRYSQCYPKSPEDVDAIEAHHHFTTRAVGVRSVTLCLDNTNVARACSCVARFDSYGWKGSITGESS